MRSRGGIARLIVALTGLLVAAGGAVTVLAPGPSARAASPGAMDPLVAWLVLAAALSLIAAGVNAWVARPGSGSSLIAFWAAAAWLAPELAGSASVSPGVRSLGLLIAPLAVPLLVHLPVRAVRADHGAARAAVLALYVAMGVVATGHALTWDAFRVYDCLPVCGEGDNVLGRFVDIPLSLTFRSTGWWLTGAAGAAMAAWSGVRLMRHRSERSSDTSVLVPALMTGVALAGWAAARLVVDRPSPVGPWSVRAMVLLAAGVLALGAGVAWVRFREGRRAAGVRRLVELLDAEAASRSLGEILATTLRDPMLRVVYPLDGDRGYVDDRGEEVAAPEAGRGHSVTPIERGATVIALVEHDTGLDPEVLSREVGAAARLAVDNERLAATLRAQVRELQASRERIVSTGDAARGRLERNLHDGAQQRLLAVSYELRLAHAAAGAETHQRRTAVDAAVREIDRALTDLRELAHGIWPAALAEAGLEAALASLADEAPIPVVLTGVPEARFPAATEAAAYLAVVEALRRAVAGAATGLAVRLDRIADMLQLEVHLPGVIEPGPWLRVDDRVGAAGGRTAVTTDTSGATLLVVELPCA
jgi:signal transduction histidine kinase